MGLDSRDASLNLQVYDACEEAQPTVLNAGRRERRSWTFSLETFLMSCRFNSSAAMYNESSICAYKLCSVIVHIYAEL